MCASNADHTAVVPLDVPAECKPGDRVWFGAAYDRPPVAEINTKKSKLLELILKDCVTDAGECRCRWGGRGASCAWSTNTPRAAFFCVLVFFALCLALSLSLTCAFSPITPFSLLPAQNNDPYPKTDGKPTFKGERAITTSGPVTSTMPNAHVG